MTAGMAGPLAGPADWEDRPVPYWPTPKALQVLAEGPRAGITAALAAGRAAADEYQATGTPQRADAMHVALLRLMAAVGGPGRGVAT